MFQYIFSGALNRSNLFLDNFFFPSFPLIEYVFFGITKLPTFSIKK